MASELETLTSLTRDLAERQTLEAMLVVLARRSAELLATPRVSVRLLDATGTRLLAAARAGAPIHEDATYEFRLGEGLIGWIAANMQPILSSDPERDPRFQPRPDIKERMASFLGVPLVTGRTCMGVLSALSFDPGAFTEHHQALLTLVAGISTPYVEVARLHRLMQLDPLTGALNRRGMEHALGGPGDEISIVMVDMDRFKDVNDQHGHIVGDQVLKHVAVQLASVVRAGDSVARYGGDEFLLVLPGVDVLRAAQIAERARAAIHDKPVVYGDVSIHVSVSCGVAQARPGETRDSLLRRADAALFDGAKAGGRNRVVTAH